MQTNAVSLMKRQTQSDFLQAKWKDNNTFNLLSIGNVLIYYLN